MDYGDVIYDQPNNDSFTDKIERLQYKTCLAIKRAIQGTSRERLYNELGLESLSSRRWCRELCAIYKLLSTQCPKYLFDTIPSRESFYNTRKKLRLSLCKIFFICFSPYPIVINCTKKIIRHTERQRLSQRDNKNKQFKYFYFNFVFCEICFLK